MAHQLNNLFVSLTFLLFITIVGVAQNMPNIGPSGFKSYRYCVQNPCDSTTIDLVSILQAFEDIEGIKSQIIKGIPYCNWTFIVCDTFGNVKMIDIENRHVKGKISPSFSNFTLMERLVLTGNDLTDVVPESLTELSLLVELDISNNKLTGRLPKFDKRVAVIATGNPFLQIESGSPTNGGQVDKSGTPSSLSWKIIVSFIIFSLVVVFVLVLVKRRQSEGAVQNNVHNHFELQAIRGGNFYSLEVLRLATNNFDENKIIGRGGCGYVYKGDLADGSEVAIKKMDFRAMEARGLNEFQAEVDALTRVRHRNIVTLLAYCMNGDERFLVYEYMPGGTLSQHLFEYNQHGYSPLTWKQRIIIALDVSRGVEYLHGFTQQRCIHRDLKPSNILLDDDMRAKVSDFGLVKNTPEEQYSMETRVAGTFGYLAPEYAATGRVSTKVDIFAFGIILMELITGRKAVDNSLEENQRSLFTWFCQVKQNEEDLHNEIDRNLDLDDETMGSISKVAELAIHCTTLERRHRPNMSYVVSVLIPLVEQWNPTPLDETNNSQGVIEGLDVHMSLPQILDQWQAEGEETSRMHCELE